MINEKSVDFIENKFEFLNVQIFDSFNSLNIVFIPYFNIVLN